MKNLILIISLSLLSNFIFSQETAQILNQEPVKSTNLFGIDFQIWATSFHYTKLLKSKIGIGIEGGIAPEKAYWMIAAGEHFAEGNTPFLSEDQNKYGNEEVTQLIFGHLYGRWKPTKFFELDAGLRFSISLHSDDSSNDSKGALFAGLYLKSTIGFKHFKVGFRIDAGKMSEGLDTKEFVMIASPLIRFNFN